MAAARREQHSRFSPEGEGAALHSAALCDADPDSSRRSETCSAASATGTTGSNWLRSRARSSIRNKTRAAGRIDGIAKRKFDRALASANALRGRYLAMPVAMECVRSRLPLRCRLSDSPPVPGCRTSVRNSARVSFCRKQPTIALVTVDECCFSIPRIIMQGAAPQSPRPRPAV